VNSQDMPGAGISRRMLAEVRTSGAAMLDEPLKPDRQAVWGAPESIAKNAKTPLAASHDREPVALWSMVDAVAASYQVPRDLPFLLILAILATSVGGRRRVRVAQDWSEVLALYTVVALPSGEKKSPVLAAVAAPLLVVEEQLRQEAAPIVAIEKARYDLRAAAVEKIKRTGKSDDATIAHLDGAVRELEQTVVPAMPRLLADDSTPEALARLMAQQDGRLGVLSAEAGLFAILAGRYSNAIPNLDLVLKAWSGDQCRVDRISRDALILTEPVLSIGLAVQPDLLAGLAEAKHFRGAGLLARFLLSLPTSRVGTRRSEDSVPIPEQVARAYGRAVQKLARSVRAAEQTSEIGLSEGARKILDEFRDELEPRLHPERGDLAHVADWANKLPGQLVRIAALFTLFTDPASAKIAETGMRQALDLARYFIGHALDAFELMSGRRSPWEPARVVLTWIQRKKLTAFSVRQAWRELGGQAWVTETDDVRKAVADLEDLGWVRPQQEPQEPRRGRPSERYDVNPAAHHEVFGIIGNAFVDVEQGARLAGQAS
jgi:replicative DNA helicase